jgi:hypothetical protein
MRSVKQVNGQGKKFSSLVLELIMLEDHGMLLVLAKFSVTTSNVHILHQYDFSTASGVTLALKTYE